MLRKLSREVSHCYAHAEDCAQKAADAATEQSRNDYLRLEQNWLTLALSYEFGERLSEFTKENQRRRVEFSAHDRFAVRSNNAPHDLASPLEKKSTKLRASVTLPPAMLRRAFGEFATIGPLRQQWNLAWPPAALALTLVATIMWISLLGYLVFSLVGYLHLPIGNAVTGGDQSFQIQHRP